MFLGVLAVYSASDIFVWKTSNNPSNESPTVFRVELDGNLGIYD